MAVVDPKNIQLTIFGEEELPYSPGFPEIVRGGERITAKERLFAQYYLETHKKRESAIRAGYSPKTAHVIANKLVKKSLISEWLKAEEEAGLKRAGVTVTRYFQELTRLAYFDIRKLFREDGSLKSPAEWDDDTAAGVVSLEINEEFSKGKEKELVGFIKKVKAADKKGCLELLAKSMGLLKENIVFPDKNGNPQDLAPKRLVVEFVGSAANDS